MASLDPVVNRELLGDYYDVHLQTWTEMPKRLIITPVLSHIEVWVNKNNLLAESKFQGK